MPRSKKYKSSTRRRVHRGGAGVSYSFSGTPVTPGAPYANTVVPSGSCLSATKFDHINGYVPPGRGGLPGYAGGGRRSTKRRGSKSSYAKFSKRVLKSLGFFKKGRRGSKRRSQRGGAAPYIVDVSQTTGGPNPFVPVVKGACEGGPVTTVQYSAPGVIQRGGVGGIDSAYLQMPNSGYSNEVPKWTSSIGVPGGGSLIQQPYAPGAMNPACIQTGAGRRSRRSRGRGRRKCN